MAPESEWGGVAFGAGVEARRGPALSQNRRTICGRYVTGQTSHPRTCQDIQRLKGAVRHGPDLGPKELAIVFWATV